jgi:DegV family protein with EDD domain
MVKIITDSTADLGGELAAEFHIEVIPLSVFIGGNLYQDGGELPPATLFELVGRTGELPKTAAPSLVDFEKAFDPHEECIYIGVSSQLSATLQNARLAQQNLSAGKVRIVDSLNLSTGIGLLALKAAELRDQGCSAQAIEDSLLASRSKVRTSFVVETMEYLHKGGRCTALQAIMGSVLKIRPVIEVRADGTMGVKAKARGTRQKALEVLLEDFEAHLPELDRSRVFVTHSGCDGDAAMLVEEINRIASPENVYITLAGSVISSHCGPDTIGILYMVK